MRRDKKNYHNRIWIVCIMTLALFLSCTGCTSKNHNTEEGPTDFLTMSEEKAKLETLIYYTIGNPDVDLAKVNVALNEKLGQNYNLNLVYKKIVWNDYNKRLMSLVKSGGNFDIAFVDGADQGDYVSNAKKGNWLALDDFLKGEGKELYDSISPLFWKGVTIDGHIYGIPTNKEVAVPEYFMFPKELVDRYNIDITKLNGLSDLRSVFSLIHEKEPEYLVMELDKNSHNFFAIDGYEYILNKQVPLMVNSLDDSLSVINIFDTDYAKEILKLLREYYLAGYINEDAAIKNSSQLEKGKKVFCCMASGGPNSEVSWSNDRGYEVVANQVSEAIATTESTRGGIMVVNALSTHPEACFEFLLALNTDPEIRNMMNYGIEGEHYILDANEQVVQLNDRYTGVQYTQGNWFLLNTRQGEPRDKWEIYQQFNDHVVASKILGFQADTSNLESEIIAVNKVWEKYYSGLMTGSVDVDLMLPQFVEELKLAGIETIQNALQEQLNAWNHQQ